MTFILKIFFSLVIIGFNTYCATAVLKGKFLCKDAFYILLAGVAMLIMGKTADILIGTKILPATYTSLTVLTFNILYYFIITRDIGKTYNIPAKFLTSFFLLFNILISLLQIIYLFE